MFSFLIELPNFCHIRLQGETHGIRSFRAQGRVLHVQESPNTR